MKSEKEYDPCLERTSSAPRGKPDAPSGGEKTDQTMASKKTAVRNLDATSQQLNQTTAHALAPDNQGVDAGTNIRQSFSNLSQATGNMAEDTEVLKHEFLKHEFFFRGFFKHRGYYSLSDLNPDTRWKTPCA